MVLGEARGKTGKCRGMNKVRQAGFYNRSKGALFVGF